MNSIHSYNLCATKMVKTTIIFVRDLRQGEYELHA